MEVPLMTEEERQAEMRPAQRSGLKSKVIQLSPIVAVAVVALAIAIGFIARDVVVSNRSLS
jgi:hypothetical protein